MGLSDLVRDSDGFRIGVCIATISVIGYLMYSDMKAKDYRVLPFDDGIKNIKERFGRDTTNNSIYNVGRIERGVVYK